MSTKWETVVNKKKGNVTKSDVKKAQQKFIQGETASKVENRDPMMLEKTLFESAFQSKAEEIPKEEKYPSRMNYEQKPSKEESSKSPKVTKEKKKEKKKPKSIGMTEKFEELDANSLKTEIKSIQEKFPASPLLWLKDITDWLRSNLQGPSDKGDVAYIAHEKGYPSNMLSGQVRNILKNLFTSCDKNNCNAFFVSVIASMVSEIQKDQPTYAHRLMIQILCEIHPDVITKNCNEIISGKSTSAESYLAVMWAFCLPVGKLEDRFSVWWSSTFSVLSKKQHGIAGIYFLRNILRSFENARIESPLLTYDQMIQLIELMVSEKSALQHTPSLMNVVQEFLPVLKKMLFTDTPANEAARVFEKMLTSLKNREASKEREMICDLLVECLLASSSAMNWWVMNMVHYMKESSVLLKYIKDATPELGDQLRKTRDYKSSWPLLAASKRMEENLQQSNHKGKFEKKPGFKECRKLCSSITATETERKENSRSFFWMVWTVVRYLFIFSFLLVVVDLYRSNGYQASLTSVYMKKYNVEDKLLQTYSLASKSSRKAQSYVAKNVPYYYAKVSPYVDPVMEKTGNYSRIAYNAIYTHSEPIRTLFNTHFPPLLEKCTYFVQRQYQIISTFIVNLYATYYPVIEEFVVGVYKWLLVSIPQAYNYVIINLAHLRKTIYDLNPELFDKMALYINDAVAYIARMLPVVLQKVCDYFDLCVTSTRNVISQGQVWMQQQMTSVAAK